MKSKSIQLFGLVVSLLFAGDLHAQCDESTMKLEEVKQQLKEIFSNNLGQESLGFQISYEIEFEGCKATVTNQADSKNKQGRPTVFSFNLQDWEGKNFKFYATKKNTQLSVKIGKDISDSDRVQYITFEGVKDNELANTLPKLISHAQCLCANSIK